MKPTRAHPHHSTPAYGEAHRKNAIHHVQRRAFERLGIALSTPDIIRLSERCAAGELGDLGLPGREGRFHVVTELRGHDVRLIYCPHLKLIVTFFQRPLGRKSGDRRLHPEVRP